MFYFQNLFLHSCFDRLSCLGSRVYRHASGQMRRMRSLPPIVHSHSLPSASVIRRRPSFVDVLLVKRYRAYSPTNFKTPAFSRDIQRVFQKLTGITCFFFLVFCPSEWKMWCAQRACNSVFNLRCNKCVESETIWCFWFHNLDSFLEVRIPFMRSFNVYESIINSFYVWQTCLFNPVTKSSRLFAINISFRWMENGILICNHVFLDLYGLSLNGILHNRSCF